MKPEGEERKLGGREKSLDTQTLVLEGINGDVYKSQEEA